MSTTQTTPPDVQAAAYAVVEYAIVSLQPEFLLWTKQVNMGVAELVWNAHGTGMAFPSSEQAEPALAGLYERLREVRRIRWGDERFLVFGLDVQHEGDDIFFTFDLTWDDGHTFQPCRIAWDFPVAGPDGDLSAEVGHPFLNLS